MNAFRFGVLPMGALALIGSLSFVHLMALPAFEDEGTQLRWVSRLIEAGEWQLPLLEGKPLEVWLMAPLFQIFDQSLAAIRALHVVAGIIGAMLVYRLGLRVSDRRAAWVSGALFAICPYVVYLQRLALSDILLCTAGVFVLISVLDLVESPTWPRAGALALGLVAAACCKLPVGFVFVAAPLLAVALMPADQRRNLWVRSHAIRLFAAVGPVLLLGLAVAVVVAIRLRRGQNPGFGLGALQGIALGGFASLGAGGGQPTPHLLSELTAQLSGPVVAIGLVGVVASAILGDWRQRWLVAVGGLPLLAIGLLAQYWFSRYLLFTLPPLIVAAVWGWRNLASRAGRLRPVCELGVLGICAALMARQSALLIVDPLMASWSPLDRYQYFEGPGSGYGYPEAAAFILAAPAAPTAIYTLDGHSAYQLLTYLPRSWRHRVQYVFYGRDGKPLGKEHERMNHLLESHPVWILISQQLLQRYLVTTFGPDGANQVKLRQIALFDKPGKWGQLALYEVIRTGGAGAATGI
jgi:Dolichyl-phosphate-mannose-protein mannosyltransferase